MRQIQKSLYHRLLYPLVDLVRRTDALATFEELNRLQWQPLSVIQQKQRSALDALLRHCYEEVPFYRDVFVQRALLPGTIDALDILTSLPIIDRETIRANATRILAKNAMKFQCRPNRTGGTTSGALHYFLSRSAHSSSLAYNLVQWHDAGYQIGDTMIYLGGPSLYPSFRSITSSVYFRLQNMVVLSSFDMSKQNMDTYVDVIRKSKAMFLRGYAGSIAMLARHIIDHGITDICLRAVFTTAETLFPHFRSSIERAFHCRAYNEYGARDGSIFAFECSHHEGLHIGSTSCIIEILDDDGNHVPPGRMGYVVATSLDNYAFPFVRYRLGDRAAMAEKLCPCGRGLPLLSNVEGRSGDFVTVPGGKKVHSEFFSHLFWEYPSVQYFQVKQLAPTALQVLVTLDNRGLSSNDRERIRHIISMKCGSDMECELRQVEIIDDSRSKKGRYVIPSLELPE